MEYIIRLAGSNCINFNIVEKRFPLFQVHKKDEHCQNLLHNIFTFTASVNNKMLINSGTVTNRHTMSFSCKTLILILNNVATSFTSYDCLTNVNVFPYGFNSLLANKKINILQLLFSFFCMNLYLLHLNMVIAHLEGIEL